MTATTLTHRTIRPFWIAVAVGGYHAATVTANVTTARYGLIPVRFGRVTTAGTYFAGLVLTLRDVIHDLTRRATDYACIGIGELASATTARPRPAIAPAVAFGVSETVDLLVCTPLLRRGWMRAALVSQDGLEPLTLDDYSFDVLFLGSAAWKPGPAATSRTARALGRAVSVHMGRIISQRRVLHANAIGCHGVDGTYLTHGPDHNLPTLLRRRNVIGAASGRAGRPCHPGGTDIRRRRDG